MQERDKLVEQHLHVVHGVAGKLKRSFARTLDYDDLVAYGYKGLVEAAERFDAREGVTFATFAYYRIRGAMFDGMRTMGWYSRADYARYKAEERTNEYLRMQDERGAAASPDGPPPSTADTLREVSDALGTVATIHIASLDAVTELADDTATADEQLAQGERSDRLRRAVAALPDKERRLMELYYFGDLNLEEAGAAMGLSKSWACRLHARAISLLRTSLEPGEP